MPTFPGTALLCTGTFTGKPNCHPVVVYFIDTPACISLVFHQRDKKPKTAQCGRPSSPGWFSCCLSLQLPGTNRLPGEPIRHHSCTGVRLKLKNFECTLLPPLAFNAHRRRNYGIQLQLESPNGIHHAPHYRYHTLHSPKLVACTK